MKVAFLTLGCKVNHYETDLLKEKFEGSGHAIVDFEEIADVYVVNSCSVPLPRKKVKSHSHDTR